MELEQVRKEEERTYQNDSYRITIKLNNGQFDSAYVFDRTNLSIIMTIRDIQEVDTLAQAMNFIKDQLEEKGTK